MKSILTLISLFFLLFGSLQSQNVNKVVDKNDLDEELLIYLIIERVNEVRAFKSLGELELNEICRLAAMDQATFISIANEIVYEQQKEGMESTYSRLLAYGGGKKSKVAENLHMIELDPTFTYIDLSDEIASAWLMEKKANKNIEGKNFTQYGIGLSVLPDENMLYVSLVFGSDAVGKDVKLPVEEEEVIEEEVVAEKEEEQPAETKEPSVEENTVSTELEESTEVAEVEVKEESTEKLEDKSDEESATVTEKTEEVEQSEQTEVVAVEESETSEVPSESVSSSEAVSSELPACLTEEKNSMLDKLTQLGVFYVDSSVYIRKKYLNNLTEVVTSDMDGIALIVKQLEPYTAGPNSFDYSLLKINKQYKMDLFRDLGADYLVMDMPEAVEGRYAFDLRYIRKGMDCIDKPIELRTADFDEALFAMAQGGGVSDLALLYDVNSTTQKKVKESRQVKFILSFNRGRSNYNEESMKAIIDKLVDPGYTISAAVVTAHTSVEGNVDLNKNLAKSRAKNIVNALRDINGGDMFYGEVKTDDSWDDFYEKVKGTKHEEFIGKDKMEVGLKITRTPSLYKELEPILKRQRYAEVEAYLEYEVVDESAEPAFGELTNIYYDFGKWYVRKDAAKALDKFSDVLKKQTAVKLMEIGSHTDARGSYAFNERLSQRRAESVVKYLTSKGVDKSRLIAKGYGESQLINHCKDGVKCTEMEHQRNRRTTFRVLLDSEEFKSIEPEDILVDYSPSNKPEMGFIDLGEELRIQLQQESPESALRVQRQIIKQVESGAMKADMLFKDTIPMSIEYAALLNNQLAAKAQYGEMDAKVILKSFKDLMKMAKGNAFVVYNNLVYQLQSNQALVDQISMSSDKKDKLLSIIDSLYKTSLPKESLDKLKAAVVNI